MLSPQQQQQLLIMRSQQSHDTSGLGIDQQQYHQQGGPPISILNRSQLGQTNTFAQAMSVDVYDTSLPIPPPMPRRKSLPSIIKASDPFEADTKTGHSGRTTTTSTTANNRTKSNNNYYRNEINNSEIDINKQHRSPDTYIIENGIRKRLTDVSNSAIHLNSPNNNTDNNFNNHNNNNNSNIDKNSKGRTHFYS
jgi:hypothetical protein